MLSGIEQLKQENMSYSFFIYLITFTLILVEMFDTHILVSPKLSLSSLVTFSAVNLLRIWRHLVASLSQNSHTSNIKL